MLNCMIKLRDKLILKKTGRVFLSAVAVVAAVSCTKVDDSLGTDFIPKNKKMQYAVDNSVKVFSYVKEIDSIRTTVLGTVPFGSYTSPRFGNVTADFAAQMYPQSLPDSLFGKSVEMDSIVLSLYVSSFVGDTNVVQMGEVYEMSKRLYRDSIYYNNEDLGRFVTSGSPLKQFNFKGRGPFVVTLPQSYAQKFLTGDVSKTGMYASDTNFYKKIPGLCFKVNTTGDASPVIYTIDLNKSYATLYLRNYGKAYVHVFNFETSETSGSSNMSAYCIKRDYSLADPRYGLDVAAINDSVNEAPVTFITGNGGLNTLVRVSEESIEQVKQSIKDKGYRTLAIQSATLEVDLNFSNGETQQEMNALNNQAPARLGAYYLSAIGAPIEDYLVMYESSTKAIPFGGYIDRLKNVYRMDITSYIQRLFSGKQTDFTFELAPDESYMFMLYHTALKGSAEGGMRLSLEYTMLR